MDIFTLFYWELWGLMSPVREGAHFLVFLAGGGIWTAQCNNSNVWQGGKTENKGGQTKRNFSALHAEFYKNKCLPPPGLKPWFNDSVYFGM